MALLNHAQYGGIKIVQVQYDSDHAGGSRRVVPLSLAMCRQGHSRLLEAAFYLAMP